jgi:hypothetical protein
MVGMGFAQVVTASAMIAQASEPTSFDATPTTSQRRVSISKGLEL